MECDCILNRRRFVSHNEADGDNEGEHHLCASQYVPDTGKAPVPTLSFFATRADDQFSNLHPPLDVSLICS